jgi:pilus assembly protein FimV
MNFRTSHLIGLMVLIVSTASISGGLFAAEPLKITGPEGQSKQLNRQYGPTTKADTFWSIAQKVRPDDGVSIYQVMAAIYDANPHAFTSDNYNSLERGMILLIPSREVMLAIPVEIAKARAERDDRGWKSETKVVAKPIAKPVTRAAQIKTPAPEVVTKTVVDTAKVSELTARLEAAEAKNISLTDMLGRAQDELRVANDDIEFLKAKIETLNDRIAVLEASLEASREQNAGLKEQNAALEATVMEPVPAEPDDTWRNLMDNPLMLVMAAVVPAGMLLGLVWMFLRRNRNRDEQRMQEAMAQQDAAPAAAAFATDDTLEINLQEDEEELEDLLDLSSVDLSPEAEMDTSGLAGVDNEDMFIDSGGHETELAEESLDEEGQSLDALWAEAIEEQEETGEEDLDDLLAEFETPAKPLGGVDDDLEALLSQLDEQDAGDLAPDEPVVDLESELDEFDMPDIDAMANVQDEVVRREQEALLPEELASESSPTEPVELQEESPMSDEDLDALLGEFGGAQETEQQAGDEAEPEEEQSLSQTQSPVPSREFTAEPEAEDVDSLWAELVPETEAAATEDDTDESEDLSAAIDAELASEGEEFDGEDLDALLAEFNIDTEKSHAQVARSDDDTLASAMEVEDAAITEEPALTSVAKPRDAEAAASRDSGFFDDLKGRKAQASANVLEWDSPASKVGEKETEAIDEIGDDDLLAAFAASTESDEEEAMVTEDSPAFDADFNLTVEEALAALDAKEMAKKSKGKPELEDELASFQQENGFIDIDRLLNEANEGKDADDALYELDVDMDLGDMDSLLGSGTMVDVDDEENSVNAKLDLARAYIEIDDEDSARALLKEVELDGNPRQQDEAKSLLKDMG